MNVQEKDQRLEDTVRRYNPGANFELIRSAFRFAEEHHRGQNRKDGSPFITHPLAVAQIVAEELHLDSESIAAALLHDTIEDTDATHEDIARTFSPTIADIVEGVSKLTRVQAASKAEEQMENLRKMLLAMSKDIRVILIKMADRLHNMRTMEYQTPEKQKQKSLETMEIYAPIAHRLGMQKMKWELEDLSLKYLDPIGYQEIIEALDEKASEYDGFMASIHDQITGRLQQAGIEGAVSGRMKHPYSIYRKMYTQDKSLDDVFDLFAFRVIVNTVSECYHVLGIIHDLYKPVLGRFKDYIGTPKPNMYQSLHTTVVGDNGIPFEVQIRTRQMHEIAEYGIAAHWKYKQNGQGEGDEHDYEWVRRLLENQEGADAEEFIHSLKVDMFADEVFVFTPQGDVINLPAGATPIDFAYSIHSAIGNHMVAAKVNGHIAQFDSKLKNGDVVEIVTSQSAHGPSRGSQQDPPVVQAGVPRREYCPRPRLLRGGGQAHRRHPQGTDGGGKSPQCLEASGLQESGRYVCRHRLRRRHLPEAHRPPAGRDPADPENASGGAGRRGAPEGRAGEDAPRRAQAHQE